MFKYLALLQKINLQTIRQNYVSKYWLRQISHDLYDRWALPYQMYVYMHITKIFIYLF